MYIIHWMICDWMSDEFPGYLVKIKRAGIFVGFFFFPHQWRSSSYYFIKRFLQSTQLRLVSSISDTYAVDPWSSSRVKVNLQAALVINAILSPTANLGGWPCPDRFAFVPGYFWISYWSVLIWSKLEILFYCVTLLYFRLYYSFLFNPFAIILCLH